MDACDDKILSETSGYETDTTIKRNVEYRCNLCSKSFDAEGKLKQHNLSEGHLQRMRATTLDTETVSTIDGTKVFNCKHCAKSFENESRLNQHKKSDGHRQKVKLLKGASQAEESFKMFPCNLEDCGRQFDSEVKLLQHQTMKHGVHAGVVSSDKGNESETGRKCKKSKSKRSLSSNGPCQRPKDFRCSEDGCDKIFPTKAQLLQHIRDKHLVDKSEPPPVRRLCMDCDEFNETAGAKPFIFLTFIAKHIITAHEKPGYIKGTCPICGTRVEKPKNLLTHISRMHLLPRFRDTACVICLRLCKNEDDLLQHSTSVHRFKCIIDTCQSMFPSKPLRDKHMLDKHSVYGCGYENCHRIFTTLDEKIEHTKTPHEGEAGPSPITCSRGMSNIHEGGVMSEPTVRLIKEPSPAYHSRNSADERCLRSANNQTYLPSIHNTLEDKMEDLLAFINEYSQQLSLVTNEERSFATFRKSEELKSAIEGVQRRLTPRVD